jgi:hypothetical protein
VTPFETWAGKLDFAFVVIDRHGNVGVFYVDGRLDAVPQEIRAACSQQDYDALTDYLIDELEPTGRGLPIPSFKHNPYDSERGLFTYVLDRNRRVFARVASPEVARSIDELTFPSNAKSCIVRRDEWSFPSTEQIPL